MRSRLLVTTGLAVGLAAGCHTPVGNYFANRGRDLGECFRVEIGAGLGLGVGVNAGPVAHFGLLLGIAGDHLGLGWSYGRGHAFGVNTEPETGDSAFVAGYGIFPLPGDGATRTGLGHFQLLRGSRAAEHSCLFLLPVIQDFAKGTSTWTRIHAWDLEVTAFAGVLHASVGFSLGEFADFVLGWFGVDIAGDDREWEPPPDQ